MNKIISVCRAAAVSSVWDGARSLPYKIHSIISQCIPRVKIIFVKNGDALYVSGEFYRLGMSYSGGIFKVFHTEQKYKTYNNSRTYTIYLTIF